MPPVKPASEPADRSMWPVIITMTIPMARIEVNTDCLNRLDRFRGLRKVPPVIPVKISQIATRAMTIM